jgi:hypothetical protein
MAGAFKDPAQALARRRIVVDQKQGRRLIFKRGGNRHLGHQGEFSGRNERGF